MRMISSTFSPSRYYIPVSRKPETIVEALRIYFTILFGVSVSMLAFYYLFP